MLKYIIFLNVLHLLGCTTNGELKNQELKHLQDKYDGIISKLEKENQILHQNQKELQRQLYSLLHTDQHMKNRYNATKGNYFKFLFSLYHGTVIGGNLVWGCRGRRKIIMHLILRNHPGDMKTRFTIKRG